MCEVWGRQAKALRDVGMQQSTQECGKVHKKAALRAQESVTRAQENTTRAQESTTSAAKFAGKCE